MKIFLSILLWQIFQRFSPGQSTDAVKPIHAKYWTPKFQETFQTVTWCGDLLNREIHKHLCSQQHSKPVLSVKVPFFCLNWQQKKGTQESSILSTKSTCHYLSVSTVITPRATPVQSLQWLALGWTVQGLIASGGRDCPRPPRLTLVLTPPPVQWAPGLSGA